MSKNFWILLSFVFSFLAMPVRSVDVENTVNLPKDKLDYVESRQLDPQAKILTDYFAYYNSPLQYHAQDFIDAAKVYSIDWKLVPAISGVESTFGKHIPGGFNAWGWGVYGNQALGFKSWREGIFTVTKGLRENYINKGLLEPYTMNRVYATSPHWGWKVAYFMNDLENFAAKYDLANLKVDTEQTLIKIAAISGQPSLR